MQATNFRQGRGPNRGAAVDEEVEELAICGLHEALEQHACGQEQLPPPHGKGEGHLAAGHVVAAHGGAGLVRPHNTCRWTGLGPRGKGMWFWKEWV